MFARLIACLAAALLLNGCATVRPAAAPETASSSLEAGMVVRIVSVVESDTCVLSMGARGAVMRFPRRAWFECGGDPIR